MGLDGGGGGGGGGGILGVGNAFTGPAQALEIYGDFCAAYSGGIGAIDTAVEWFSFTTGNYLAVVTFQLNAPVKANTPLDLSGLVAVLKMNNTVIANLVVNPQSAPEAVSPTFVTQDLIFPPYTEFSVSVTSDSEDLDDIGSAIITGRIYRD